MKSLTDRINKWLNDAPPFKRYLVAFGGLIAAAALTTALSAALKSLMGW